MIWTEIALHVVGENGGVFQEMGLKATIYNYRVTRLLRKNVSIENF